MTALVVFLACGWPGAPLAEPRFGEPSPEEPTGDTALPMVSETGTPEPLDPIWTRDDLAFQLLYSAEAWEAIQRVPDAWVPAQLVVDEVSYAVAARQRSYGDARLDVQVEMDAFVEGQELGGMDELTFRLGSPDPRGGQALTLYAAMGLPAPRFVEATLAMGPELAVTEVLLVEGADGRLLDRYTADPDALLVEVPAAVEPGVRWGDALVRVRGDERQREVLRQLGEALDARVDLAELEPLIDLDAWVRYHATFGAMAAEAGGPLDGATRAQHLFVDDGRVVPLAAVEWGAFRGDRHPHDQESAFLEICRRDGPCQEALDAAIWEAVAAMDALQGVGGEIGAFQHGGRHDALQEAVGLLPEVTSPVAGPLALEVGSVHSKGLASVDLVGVEPHAWVELFLVPADQVEVVGGELLLGEGALALGGKRAGERGIQSRRGALPAGIGGDWVFAARAEGAGGVEVATVEVEVDPVGRVEVHPGLGEVLPGDQVLACWPAVGACPDVTEDPSRVLWIYATGVAPALPVVTCSEVAAEGACCYELSHGADAVPACGPRKHPAFGDVVWW